MVLCTYIAIAGLGKKFGWNIIVNTIKYKLLRNTARSPTFTPIIGLPCIFRIWMSDADETQCGRDHQMIQSLLLNVLYDKSVSYKKNELVLFISSFICTITHFKYTGSFENFFSSRVTELERCMSCYRSNRTDL